MPDPVAEHMLRDDLPVRVAEDRVAVDAVNTAMTADLQDGKAHHLNAPRPVPAPPFFLPLAHVSIRSVRQRQGIYDQDSAICAIASKRLEPPSGISAIAISGMFSAVGARFRSRLGTGLVSLRWLLSISCAAPSRHSDRIPPGRARGPQFRRPITYRHDSM